VRFVVDKVALVQVARYFCFACQYQPINAAHSSSSTRCSYQKDKRAKPGNLPESKCSFGNRGSLGGKELSFDLSMADSLHTSAAVLNISIINENHLMRRLWGETTKQLNTLKI
jgi:hypothetical protein